MSDDRRMKMFFFFFKEKKSEKNKVKIMRQRRKKHRDQGEDLFCGINPLIKANKISVLSTGACSER